MARGSKRGHDKWSRRHDASDADLTFPQGDPLADEAGGTDPFDLAAVQRDDALIDAILGGGEVATATEEEYRLASLLAGWRAEVVGPDLPQGPTLDEVVAAVDEERRRMQPSRSAGGLRLLRPIAGAAAAVAVVMAGLTVFSYNAQPGDPLWRVKEVVFTERAHSTVATIDTANTLEKAERMIRSGDAQGAMTVLQSASKRVGDVGDADKRNELNAWHDRLLADAAKTPTAVPTTTTAPGVTTTLPGLPVTTVPGSGSSGGPSVPSQAPVSSVAPTTEQPTSTPPPAQQTTTQPPVTTTPSATPRPPVSTEPDVPTATRLTPTAAPTSEIRQVTPDTPTSG